MGQLLITLGTLLLILISGFVILLVLMQRGSAQGGLGTAFGGGVAETAFGADTANVLTKGTVFAIAAFFVLSFVLYLGNLAVSTGGETGRTTDFQALTAETRAAEDLAADQALRDAISVEGALMDAGENAIEDAVTVIETIEETADQAAEDANEAADAAAKEVENAAEAAGAALESIGTEKGTQ